MPRKRRPFHHGDLKRALLTASLRILETEGVGGLSLRRVASEAGVTHGAPYHHFRDKTELMAVIAIDGFRMLASEMREAHDKTDGDPVVKLTAVGKAYVRFALDHRAHFAVMFRPELTNKCDHGQLDPVPDEAFEFFRKSVLDVLEAGFPVGAGFPVDVRLMLLMCWAIPHGLAELWLNGPLQTMGQFAEIDSEMLFKTIELLAFVSSSAQARNA